MHPWQARDLGNGDLRACVCKSRIRFVWVSSGSVCVVLCLYFSSRDMLNMHSCFMVSNDCVLAFRFEHNFEDAICCFLCVPFGIG